MRDMAKIQAAQAAIANHQADRRLEAENSPATDLYHLLDSLLEWADANGVDFDCTLSELRSDIAEEGARANG